MNIAIELLQGAIILACVLVAAYIVSLAIKVWFADETSYVINRNHSKDFKTVVFGRLDPWVTESERDHVVKAGLAYDERSKKWISMGALSDEAVSRVLK